MYWPGSGVEIVEFDLFEVFIESCVSGEVIMWSLKSFFLL